MVTWRGYVLIGVAAGFISAAVSLAVAYILVPNMRPLQQQPPIVGQRPIPSQAVQVPFPDFGYAPPASRLGDVFRYSEQNYPDPKINAKQLISSISRSTRTKKSRIGLST